MLYSMPFGTLTQLINDCFLSWDDSIRPPLSIRPILEEDKKNYKGVMLQFALAGYKKEDVEVYSEKDVLYVKGNNSSRKEVADKFKGEFLHKFPVSKELDLSQATAELEDGLLTITIPLCKSASTPRSYLLGK